MGQPFPPKGLGGSPNSTIAGDTFLKEARKLKNGYRVLDSDLHLMEPPDIYERYLESAYRDRAP